MRALVKVLRQALLRGTRWVMVASVVRFLSREETLGPTPNTARKSGRTRAGLGRWRTAKGKVGVKGILPKPTARFWRQAGQATRWSLRWWGMRTPLSCTRGARV